MSKKIKRKYQVHGEDVKEKTLNELMGFDHTHEYPGFNTVVEYESYLNSLSSTAVQNEAIKRGIIPNQENRILRAKLIQKYNSVYYQYNTKGAEAQKVQDAQVGDIPKKSEEAILKIMARGK